MKTHIFISIALALTLTGCVNMTPNYHAETWAQATKDREEAFERSAARGDKRHAEFVKSMEAMDAQQAAFNEMRAESERQSEESYNRRMARYSKEWPLGR